MKATASNQSISWFFQRYREDALELSADFQRNPVWLQPQKEYLVETVLLELPMPEVYLVNRIQPTGESTYIVVDGQQRLRTLLEFINGDLILKHPLERFPRVRRFGDLSDAEKQRFWRYPVVVRDLEDSTDDDIRGLFQRLNKYSVVLNEQELRNARFKGHFLKTVQRISEEDFWTTSGLFSANDIRRMIDLEYISILLSTMMGGIFNRRERVDEFYVMYEEEFENAEYYIDRVKKNLQIIEVLLPNIKVTRWRNKAEFYTLFLVVDDLDVLRADGSAAATAAARLRQFEEQVQRAKAEMEGAEKQFIDYLDAATYGTNDKEKRVRRDRILREYLTEAGLS